MKKVAQYEIQAPNATATNVLRSWLNVVGIPNQRSNAPGFDLSITQADGSDLQVQVLVPKASSNGGFGVQATAITGKNPERALNEFWKVTDAAGYPRQRPLDRGDAPELNERGNVRKLHYKDEDFLVTIRHTEFRRSPNPSDDQWKQYKDTMEKVVWKFMKGNYDLCARHGLEISDLMSYARCYVVNFCAHHATPTPKFFDNERKCYRYLQQRFSSDLRSVLLKKQRSMMPDSETLRLGLFGALDMDPEVSPNPEDSYVKALDGVAADHEEEVDYDYVARNCQLDTTSPSARKASAAAKLGELLSNLPHDKMLEMLKETSTNNNFDCTTRREAARYLRQHQAECQHEDCIQSATEETSVIEETPVTEKLDSSCVPQVSSLSKLREVVSCFARGLSDKNELSDACFINDRNVSYYRQAARAMGLLDDDRITDTGRVLLKTGVDSVEEADAFRTAIFESANLRVFAWFFEDESATTQDLCNFVMENYNIGENTAKDRARRIASWRKKLGSGKVLQVNEDAAGLNAGG